MRVSMKLKELLKQMDNNIIISINHKPYSTDTMQKYKNMEVISVDITLDKKSSLEQSGYSFEVGV